MAYYFLTVSIFIAYACLLFCDALIILRLGAYLHYVKTGAISKFNKKAFSELRSEKCMDFAKSKLRDYRIFLGVSATLTACLVVLSVYVCLAPTSVVNVSVDLKDIRVVSIDDVTCLKDVASRLTTDSKVVLSYKAKDADFFDSDISSGFSSVIKNFTVEESDTDSYKVITRNTVHKMFGKEFISESTGVILISRK